MDYILGPKPDSCVLCLPPDDLSHDEERLVLYRGKTAFVIMNKFPYNNGHIMVAPLRHVMDLPLLAAEESTEIMELLKQCTTILREFFKPQGINVGLNLTQTPFRPVAPGPTRMRRGLCVTSKCCCWSFCFSWS